MKNFSRGVSYYTKGTVEIGFPEDDICCWRCPMMGTETHTQREYCRRTGEYLPAPRDIIGMNCPIEFKKEEEKCSEI
jgi:hypothetical protein